ncbi:hypothetical protein V5740_12030 [Croceibacterium sp. TMG7-5b_MA50]|uniref:hypothetical protein n=1 Tax=Croceibacterium sp. TMG7-5b_MA50 TaxID=3121290 RepID=UPI0032213E2E
MTFASSVSVARSATVLSRFGAAIIGGYLFAYGLTAAITLAGFAAGLPFFEAQTLAWLMSFLLYGAAVLWAFAEPRLPVVWLVLGGGGCAMVAACWFVSRQMV